MQQQYGINFTTVVTGNQTGIINMYNNLKHKILRCNANIYFNEQYLENNLTPKFANIKIRHLLC